MAGSVVRSASGSYAGSVASSRSSASQRARAEHEHREGAGDDLLDRRSSLESGIFGVLYTLRKENNETRVRIRWVLLKILLDAWQLFATVISPEGQGWTINAHGWAWTVVSVVNFNWLADLSYGWYLVLLYVMVGLLGLHVVLCVWVAWCFKEQKFGVVWPIKLLRLYSSVFFQAFDVAAMNLLELGITCRFTGYPSDTRMRFDLFPEYSCSSTPHVMHAVVSGLGLGFFVAVALLSFIAEVEVNLLSRRPFALGHSGPAVIAFAFKVLITLVRVFIGWRRVQAGLYLGFSLAFAWQFLRKGPHLVNWVNYLKAGVSTLIVWCSAVLMLLVFHPGIKEHQMKGWADIMTLLMIVGLAPAFAVGALLSWALIRRLTNVTLAELKNAKPGAPVKDICTAVDSPLDVAIVSRCCRVWKDKYTVDPVAADKARHVIQAGIAMFPTSAYMVLLQANFMIDVLGVSQSGSRRIEDARKLNPGLMSRFIMFVRQQEASQQAAGSYASGGASMDLLAYVEYQRKQRMVVRLHREALQAMCNFWKMLESSRVSFTLLSKALAKIETSVSQAQTAYRVVLENYGSNPKLVRLYGKFLLTIKNDPWRASEYFTEADRLQEMQNGDAGGGPLLPDGTPLGRMDELATAVLVISANGDVQMANRQAHLLFGYKRGTLEGKPLATLLAPHYARWLADHLAYLADCTDSVILAATSAHDLSQQLPQQQQQQQQQLDGGSNNFCETVVGMHSDRLAFPMKLALRKASGVAEDSTFIAMMEVMPAMKGVASLWVSNNGTIVACDPQFVMSFGWKPQEVNGVMLTTLMAFQNLDLASSAPTAVDLELQKQQRDLSTPVEATATAQSLFVSPTEAVNRLLRLAMSNSEATQEGLQCLTAHKYSSTPLQCMACVQGSGGALDSSVYTVRIAVRDAASSGQDMLVVNRKGAIVHASADVLIHLTGIAEGRGGVSQQPGGSSFLRPKRDGPKPIQPAVAGALVPTALMMGVEQLEGFTLCDLMPSPWKEMHYKYLRGTTALTPASHNLWSCRKEGIMGPTLEMRNTNGKPLFMRIAVSTTDTSVEINHVIKMSLSSLEAALGERRLRLQVSGEGVISSVQEGPAAGLLGLNCSQLSGRPFWDFIDWSRYAESGSLPAMGPLMFAALVKREMLNRGTSWRVQVSPPVRMMSEAAGNMSDLMALARSSMKKTALLQVHIEIPSEMETAAGADPAIFVDLWCQNSVSGVLEVDGVGRIRAIVEEHIRPSGLLFGVATQSLVGSQLGEFVAMPAGRTKPADLLFLNGAKKSSLKTTTAESSVKVGPVHVLQAAHADGLPNMLDVQVVSKTGSNSNMYVVLRPHTVPMFPTAGVPSSPPPPPRPPGAGVAFGAVIPTGGTTGAGSYLQHRPSTASDPKLPATKALAYPAAADNNCRKSPKSSSTGGGVVAVSTPPEHPLKRRCETTLPADDNNGSEPLVPPSSLLDPLALPPPPPPPDGLARLGGGLPVPVVVPTAVVKAVAPPPITSREKLACMVKSVQGSRQATASDRTALGGGEVAPIAAPLPAAADVESVNGEADGHDGAPPNVALNDKERISTWVASKGAYYQNSVLADGRGDKGEEDGGKRLDSIDGLPENLGPRELKAIFRGDGGGGGGGGGSDDDDLDDAKTTTEEPLGSGTHNWAWRRQEVNGASCPAEDDAGSEGGQSALSGQSGDGGADYKRGKRFRKLMKLMDSGQTQQVQQRYRLHALVTVALLAAVHIVCFAMTMHSIRTKRDSMLQLGRSGQAQRYMHQILTDVRSLDMISKNKSHPNLYNASKADAEFFIQRIAKSADEVQIRVKNILDSHHTSTTNVRDLLFFTTRTVWDGKDDNGTDKFANITIWDFCTRFYAMAKEVQQNGMDWVNNHVDIVGNTTAGQFLIRSGPDLWKASRKILDGLLYVAVDDAQWVDNLQIVFLCVEGAAITSVAACYLAYLLKAVSEQRYKLYSTFMHIPLGLTRALASQNTTLTVDEEDDEDDSNDGDEKGSYVEDNEDIGGDEAALKQKRRAMLAVSDNNNNNSCSPPLEGYNSALGHGRDALPTSPKSAAADGAFLGTHYRRNSRSFKAHHSHGHHSSSSPIVAMGAKSKTSSGSVLRHFAGRLRGMVSRMGARIVPLQNGSEGALEARRQLKYDSHETRMLLMPFIIWSALVITIYVVAVSKMSGIVEVLAVHSVVNFIAARTYRAVFYCQELAAVVDKSKLPQARAAVAAVWKVVQDAWYTLQLGSDAYKAIGPNTERFPLVKRGLASSSGVLSYIFYGDGQCHRVPESRPCPGPEYRFYLSIRAGLDSMMHQFMMHVDAMASSKATDAPGLGDAHLDFIYNVGTKDLMDGTVEIQEAHSHIVMTLFDDLLILHVILLILFWAIFASFLIFLLNPLLKRISRERRRVAELMSQLPLELDVERLVARALGAVGNGGTPVAGAGGSIGSAAAGSVKANQQGGGETGTNSLAFDGNADAVTKWKSIIRAASSQLFKVQTNGSMHSSRRGL
ncbi:hypothetical protein VaNZ11_002822 [Volvox africanus]|uniref:PAS domain-containing protein n=1 Tax=Volvox africanus TaxID=51714 RepID=A0ABQ5RU28_9CHLO|nr:hypothetical protein VaNZ11_002822 [Volvox africanus]